MQASCEVYFMNKEGRYSFLKHCVKGRKDSYIVILPYEHTKLCRIFFKENRVQSRHTPKLKN